MRNSLRNRPRLRGSLLSATLLVAVLSTSTRTVVAATSIAAPLPPIAVRPILKAEPSSNLLADEITRRLRRMGINFSRTRLAHPYDPIGEIC